MKQKNDFTLKPETISMLKRALLLMSALYGLSVLLFCGAGTLLDYQTAIEASQRLTAGLRSGVGLLLLGFLFMECK